MIKFRQKEYSIIGDAVRGASIGASAGTILSGGLKIKGLRTTDIGQFNDKLPAAVIGGGAILGAALGGIYGTAKSIDQAISKGQANKRLMVTVKENLGKLGFKEGEDFTQDPKKATNKKLKVCIVMTRNSGELRLNVNTVADPKLKTITNEITKNLPGETVSTEKVTDKFNDLSITSISGGTEAAGLITGIVEMFIRRGYSVYLVEVG